MPDYQHMYTTLFHATEQAVELLINAQRQCEEIYVSSPAQESSDELTKTEPDGE